MHGIIYQISDKPIAESDYLHIDNIVAGEMASISYVYDNNDDGCEHDIKFLLDHILPKGMFTLSAENTFIYNGD